MRDVSAMDIRMHRGPDGDALPIGRPLLRWHGGKWRLAPWIISHFPTHRIYCEPFGGAASVLLRKPRCYAEVYNDLDADADVVNLFRVLRSREATALRDALRLTPFSRVEFNTAMSETSADPVERARLLVVRSFMGFGSNGHNPDSSTGFRATSNRSGSTPAHDWANHADCLDAIVARLRGVVIEQRDALDVMATNDGAETLHYVDPPYLPETRSARARRRNGRIICYAHELSADDHMRLLVGLRDLRGMVALSGYPSALYDDALPDWRRVERAARADGAAPRVEALWLNPQLSSALRRRAAGGDTAMFGWALP